MAFRKRSRFGRTRRKTRMSGRSGRKGPRTFKARVTQVLMKKTETKYFDRGVENEQLYHNSGTQQILFPGFIRSIPDWFNPWSFMAQGTTRLSRIGDKITPRGMRVTMFLANKTDRPNTMCRVVVAILPKVLGTTITTARFDPFQSVNSGTCGNYMLLPPDTDKGVRFIYDRIHRMPPQQVSNVDGPGTKKEMTKIVRLWIKRKNSRDVTYDTSGVDIINKPLAIYIIPYEQYSTLNTDNIASITGNMRMYYKDV